MTIEHKCLATLLHQDFFVRKHGIPLYGVIQSCWKHPNPIAFSVRCGQISPKGRHRLWTQLYTQGTAPTSRPKNTYLWVEVKKSSQHTAWGTLIPNPIYTKTNNRYWIFQYLFFYAKMKHRVRQSAPPVRTVKGQVVFFRLYAAKKSPPLNPWQFGLLPCH